MKILLEDGQIIEKGDLKLDPINYVFTVPVPDCSIGEEFSIELNLPIMREVRVKKFIIDNG